MNLFRKILSLMCAIVLICSAVLPSVAAAAGQSIIYADTVEAEKGSGFYVYVRAENLMGTAVLDLEIYYDSEFMTLNSVSAEGLLSSWSNSINSATIGTVKVSSMSLEEINGSGTLLLLHFTAKSDCPAEEFSPITVTVGDAYNLLFQPVSIQSKSGGVTIKEREITYENFNIYANYSASSLKNSQTTTITVSHDTYDSFVCADFSVSYDRELFEVESVELASGLSVENAMYNINTDTAGIINISYISLTPVNSYNLFTVVLKAVNEDDAEATVNISASDAYRDNDTPYTPYSFNLTFSLYKKDAQVKYPSVYLEPSEYFLAGQIVTSQLLIEKNSALAAGDFTLTYDTDVAECVSVSASSDVTANGGMVVINPKYSDGKIKFSYVNTEGASEQQALLDITWKLKENATRHFCCSISGSNVVNVSYENIRLDYSGSDICILEEVVTPATENENGSVYYVCTQGQQSSKVIPAEEYPESEHDYGNSVDITYTFSHDGAESLYVKFSELTDFENSYDKVFITDSKGNDVGTFTDNQLAGVELFIPADGFTIRLKTDGSVTRYGFKIDSITAIYPICEKDDILIDVLHATGHKEIVTSAKAPTCTEYGWDEYVTCTSCDYSTYVMLPELGHIDEYHEKKAPTCTKIGWNEYVTCARCDYTTYKELPATGHKDMSPVTENNVLPTCTQNGSFDTVVYCSVCEEELSREQTIVDAFGHTELDPVVENNVPPTCTKEGNYDSVIYCSVCKEEVSRENIVVKAFGHTEAKAVIENNIPPTCTQNGSFDTVVYCSVCEAELSREQTIVDALGHTELDPIVENDVPPTCTKEGNYDSVVYCSVCKEEVSRENIVVKAFGHTEAKAVIENNVPPTCTQNGSFDTVVYCSVCEAELSREQTIVDALGHTELAPVTENNVPPTCTKEGNYDSVIYCSVCKEEVLRENITVNAFGHTEDDAVIENNVPPTCTKDGSYDSVKYCAVCKTELSRVHKISEKLGHAYKAVVTAPTCTATGFTTNTCSRCDDAYVSDELQALGHVNGAPVKENYVSPACTKDGSYDSVVYCSRCGIELSREKITVAAEGHNRVYHSAKSPTCTDAGWNAYETCTRCSYSTYASISALGHAVISHGAKAATCTEKGWNAYETCSRCNYSTYSEIAKTGHKYNKSVVAPTCIKEGYSVYTCRNCNHSYTADKTSAKGHAWGEWKISVAPTTEKAGLETRICNSCKQTQSRNIDKLIPAEIEIKEDNKKVAVTSSGFAAVHQNMKVSSLIGVSNATAVYSKDNVKLSGDAVLATGMIIVLEADGKIVDRMEVVSPGDIDGDAKISSADARLALRRSVGLETFTGASLAAAKVNGEDKVSASDARLILRASVGLEKTDNWLLKIK